MEIQLTATIQTDHEEGDWESEAPYSTIASALKDLILHQEVEVGGVTYTVEDVRAT